MKPILQKLSLFTFLSIFTFSSFGQAENALDFDGTNDVVTAPNASVQIANSTTGMSISCWVYAKNTAPSFPDFDGILGFRDNATCDFYLLQLSGTTLEGRFRNSLGTNYDVSITGFQTNTWQHLVMTYDGSTLKGYLNGSLIQSQTASGSITSAVSSFTVGNLIFGTTNFNLNGQVDEAALWKKALTSAEINCMYKYGHDTSDTDLKLYYKFNQGIANGGNATIASITDSKGNINATLSGFTLNGSFSNFVSGVVQSGQQTSFICKGDSLLFGGVYLKDAGVYTGSVSTVEGCDSIVNLTLGLDSVNTMVTTLSDTSFQADLAGAAYQWIDCATNQPIAGATNQIFVATQNGSYACQITDTVCTGTSNCVTVSNISIFENEQSIAFHLYPNPAKDKLTFDFEKAGQDVDIKVLDYSGRIVEQFFFKATQSETLSLNLQASVYLIQVQTKDGTRTEKLVIQD